MKRFLLFIYAGLVGMVFGVRGEAFIQTPTVVFDNGVIVAYGAEAGQTAGFFIQGKAQYLEYGPSGPRAALSGGSFNIHGPIDQFLCLSAGQWHFADNTVLVTVTGAIQGSSYTAGILMNGFINQITYVPDYDRRTALLTGTFTFLSDDTRIGGALTNGRQGTFSITMELPPVFDSAGGVGSTWAADVSGEIAPLLDQAKSGMNSQEARKEESPAIAWWGFSFD